MRLVLRVLLEIDHADKVKLERVRLGIVLVGDTFHIVIKEIVGKLGVRMHLVNEKRLDFVH